MADTGTGFSISDADILSVDTYRRRRNTSVLTIMFTDIQNFTRMTEEEGEEFSARLRAAHDDILVETIQEGGAGLVVKHIGDSIMAVFSEPSSAVEKALKIQERIRRFNEDNPARMSLKVRIGLHMGQVAVENRIAADFFGRHVNRASRVEGLADGGQIYVTYSVFDSARGWLAGQKSLQWKHFGKYFLKGIEEAVDVYEVVDGRFGHPKQPAGARRKRTLPRLVPALALVVVGAGLALFVLRYQKTSVVFMNFHPQELYMDGATRIQFDGREGEAAWTSLTRIRPGRHVFHYDVSAMVRYYAVLDITRGKNVVEPRFDWLELPALEVRLEPSDNPKETLHKSTTSDYYFYDAQNRKVPKKATIDITIDSHRDPAKPREELFSIRWSLVLDGKEAGSGTRNDSSSRDETEIRNVDEVVIYKDPFHYYGYKYYVTQGVLDLTFQSYFSEYLSPKS